MIVLLLSKEKTCVVFADFKCLFINLLLLFLLVKFTSFPVLYVNHRLSYVYVHRIRNLFGGDFNLSVILI